MRVGSFLAAAYEGNESLGKPADRDGTFSVGLGARLQPLSWASLEALGVAGVEHYLTSDVNLRGWYGPSHTIPMAGVRLQATAGPRFQFERSPVLRSWAPVFFAAHAWTWSRHDHDRFRSWGGASRWLELGLGLEFTAR